MTAKRSTVRGIWIVSEIVFVGCTGGERDWHPGETVRAREKKIAIRGQATIAPHFLRT
jgi:hypothetical protein